MFECVYTMHKLYVWSCVAILLQLKCTIVTGNKAIHSGVTEEYQFLDNTDPVFTTAIRTHSQEALDELDVLTKFFRQSVISTSQFPDSQDVSMTTGGLSSSIGTLLSRTELQTSYSPFKFDATTVMPELSSSYETGLLRGQLKTVSTPSLTLKHTSGRVSSDRSLQDLFMYTPLTLMSLVEPTSEYFFKSNVDISFHNQHLTTSITPSTPHIKSFKLKPIITVSADIRIHVSSMSTASTMSNLIRGSSGFETSNAPPSEFVTSNEPPKQQIINTSTRQPDGPDIKASIMPLTGSNTVTPIEKLRRFRKFRSSFLTSDEPKMRTSTESLWHPDIDTTIRPPGGPDIRASIWLSNGPEYEAIVGTHFKTSIIPTDGPNNERPIGSTIGTNTDTRIQPTAGSNADTSVWQPAGPNFDTSIWPPAGPNFGTPIRPPAGPNFGTSMEPSAGSFFGSSIWPAGPNFVSPIGPSDEPNFGTSIGPPAGPNFGTSIEPPAGPNFGTPIGPPAGPNFGTSIEPPAGPNFGTPIGPPAGPSFASIIGPPDGPNFGTSIGPPAGSLFDTSEGPPSGQKFERSIGPPVGPNIGTSNWTRIGPTLVTSDWPPSGPYFSTSEEPPFGLFFGTSVRPPNTAAPCFSELNYNEQNHSTNLSSHNLTKNGESLGSNWIQDTWFNQSTFSAITFLETICPGSLLCNTSVSRTVEGEQTCCSACSCSIDCIESGNCCVDFEGPYVNRLTSGSCVSPVLPGKSYLNLEPADRKTYLMIDECPAGVNNPNESNVPVFSTATNRTYKGKGIALCNGEKISSLIDWTQKVTCSIAIFLFEVEDLATFIERVHNLPYCYITWLPLTLPVKECQNDITMETGCDRCSVYGPWLNDLCESGLTAPYGFRGGWMYKNVFCFGCSYLSKFLTMDTCEVETEERIRSRQGMTVFSGTFDPAVLDAYFKYTSSDQRNFDCTTGFELIPGLGSCIREVCALTQVRMEGKCTSMFRTVSGIDVEYRVDYRVPESHVNLNNLSLIYKTLANKSNWLIKDDNINMNIIIATRTETCPNIMEEGYVHFTQSTRRRVGFQENIQESFYRFKERVLSARLMEIYSPKLSQRSRLQTSSPIFYLLYNEPNAFNQIAMTDLQFCDTIQVPFNQQGVKDDYAGILVGRLFFYHGEYYTARVILRSYNLLRSNIDIECAHICKALFEERLSRCRDCNVPILTSSESGIFDALTTRSGIQTDVSLANTMRAPASIILYLWIITLYLNRTI